MNLLQEFQTIQKNAAPAEMILANVEALLSQPKLITQLKTDTRELAKLLYPLIQARVANGHLCDINDLTNMEATDPLAAMLLLLMGAMPHSIVASSLRVAYITASAVNSGGVYTVTPNLSAQLLETEVRGLLCADLRLPYANVFIEFGKLPHVFVGKGEAFQLRAVSVQETTNRRWIVVADLANSKYHTFMHTNCNLEQNVLLAKAIDESAGQAEDEEAQLRRKIILFVANVVLYATWPDAEVEHVLMDSNTLKLWEKIEAAPPSKRRDRLQAMLASMNTTRTNLLGRSVIAVSRQQAMQDDQALGRNTGAKLMAYQHIGGFWRNQPYGPHNSLRRRQWIRPYWRGPEDSPLATPVHRLTMREST
jgi:hypothetical protein